MNAKKLAVFILLFGALMPLLGSPRPRHAQDDKNPYPKMAPLDQYLMDRGAEIALARSAAPESISRDATVTVLGRQGYETAVQGKNGFVCNVDRAWTQLFDQPTFWNPKIRGAVCYNPPAARSVLPVLDLRARLVLAGLSKEEIAARIKAAYARNELPPLEPGSMSFMMSKGSYLTDDGCHNISHVMFYTPVMDGANWGADLPNSPVSLLPQFRGAPEPINVFILPTRQWSDGTPQLSWAQQGCASHTH